MSSKSTQLPLQGLLIDSLLLLMLLALQQFDLWIETHVHIVYWGLGILQALALFFVISGGAMKDPKVPKGSLLEHLLILKTLMLLLAIGGFMWLFLPALMTNQWGVFMLNFFVVLFGSLIAFAMGEERAKKKQSLAFEMQGTIIISIYLLVSEAILYSAAHIYNIPLGVILLCLGLSYLPIRFLMIFKPPYHNIELLTSTTWFVYFIVSLT
ncbi:MAG: hypothetical protein GY810_09600 [Aureispira sp.]|nr:hypothetical protein [Aureispira sp.]